MSDAQDAPAGVNIKSGGKGKVKLSLPTVLSATSLAVSIVLGGYIGYDKIVQQPQTISTISSYISQVSTDLTNKINGVQSFTEEDVANIESQITSNVNSNIEQTLETKLSKAKSQTINDIQVWFQQNPPQFEVPPQPAIDTNLVVNTVLNRLRQSGELESSASTIDQYARQRLEKIQSELDGLNQQISNATLMAKSSGVINTPKRLKEFNIIAPPLKDNTVFVIDAPKKNGKSNTITLTMGETFYSKHGAHKVIGIEDGANGVPRLRVTGHFFIDSKREEFTPAELAALKKAKAKKNKAKSVTPPSTRHKAKAEQASKVASNMVELKNWSVITTKPKEKEVLVYNPNTNAPLSLKENTYVAGIGTVRNINLQTGETQFERYFIRGNQ